MTSLKEINHVLKQLIYLFFVFSMLFLFRKMARHQHKSSGLLMILILAGPIFIVAIIKLFLLFGINNQLLQYTIFLLSKFTSFWSICLAIYHYSILKAFNEKFWRFPFKRFILIASFLCLTFSLLTNHESLRRWNGDFVLLDVFSSLVLWFIFFSTRKLKNGITFDPYNIQDSASKLIRFSFTLACFSGFYLIFIFVELQNNCFTMRADSEIFSCEVCSFIVCIVNQAWIWYAIVFNWKMISTSERIERSKDRDSLLNVE